MSRLRDYQRSKLYSAENKAFANVEFWKKNEFKTLAECADFAKEIVNSNYWTRHKGWKRIKLNDGRGCRNAAYWYNDRSVTLPIWARNKLVIIHEFAHYLTHKTQQDPVGHGSHFAAHYLELVDEIMGMEYSMLLMEQYDLLGVKYHFSKK